MFGSIYALRKLRERFLKLIPEGEVEFHCETILHWGFFLAHLSYSCKVLAGFEF